MNMQLVMQVAKKFVKKVPVIRTGNTVRIHQRIKEGGKERTQIFEGLVIAINSGYATDKTITVRKMVGGIGVEKIFPLYSTNISKIQVIKESKIRRAKLYYMRERSGKSARLKERHLSEKDVIMEDLTEEEVPEVVEEAPVATETPEVVVTTPEVAEEAVVEETPAVEATDSVEASEIPDVPVEEVVEETPKTEEEVEEEKTEEGKA
jgi:large subunit ribosomal protein L19